MKIWHVGKRWMVTDSDLKPKNATESEYARCQILGDYPTYEHALAGAKLTLENRRKNREKYALPHQHHRESRNRNDPN